jgi:prepilin signal peptidase PulO-like enzyme (type II secretory pathway)
MQNAGTSDRFKDVVEPLPKTQWFVDVNKAFSIKHSGFLGAQVWLSRGRAVGEGDPWLGALMGAYLGWPHIGIAFYITYVLGGVIILLLYVLGIVRRGSRIPFAPFLALGTLGAVLYGRVVEEWVKGLF